jgi:hypothetical protein
MREQLNEAHRRVKDLAKEMSEEGLPDDVIIDALLCVGGNAYGQLAGREALAQTFREFADQIEIGATVSGKQH